MEHIGIDVHKVESQLCILTENGEIIESRIRTQRERFGALLDGRARAKVLIEASTESEWVARCLEGLGHEVIVTDPNFAAMYAVRRRRRSGLRTCSAASSARPSSAWRANAVPVRSFVRLVPGPAQRDPDARHRVPGL